MKRGYGLYDKEFNYLFELKQPQTQFSFESKGTTTTTEEKKL